MAQLVEHHLAKVRVAGSSPVFRSDVETGSDADSVVIFLASTASTYGSQCGSAFQEHLGEVGVRLNDEIHCARIDPGLLEPDRELALSEVVHAFAADDDGAPLHVLERDAGCGLESPFSITGMNIQCQPVHRQ